MAVAAVSTADQVQKVAALLGVAVLRWRDQRESSENVTSLLTLTFELAK